MKSERAGPAPVGATGAVCSTQIMRQVEDMIEKVALVKDGFKPVRELTDHFLADNPEDEALALAHALYRSEVHQARMMVTILLGRLSVTRPEAVDFLRSVVSHDPDWRMQEMLAMAFDTYCKVSATSRPCTRSRVGSAILATPCGARCRRGFASGPTAPISSSTPSRRSRCWAG